MFALNKKVYSRNWIEEKWKRLELVLLWLWLVKGKTFVSFWSVSFCAAFVRIQIVITNSYPSKIVEKYHLRGSLKALWIFEVSIRKTGFNLCISSFTKLQGKMGELNTFFFFPLRCTGWEKNIGPAVRWFVLWRNKIYIQAFIHGCATCKL